ncbi:MAG: helix-turn-helix domain-containing protein [Myxococcales bacterium]|nr:helix-turn-helix domain-containing protein [Myxococcales bacterium]
MRPRARFVLPSGAEVDLGPGDVVGRHAGMALVFDDPSISEAHAMLSLRGAELLLLALRRRFEVDETGPRSEVVLEPGLRITLSENVVVECVEVDLPAKLLGLRVDDGPPVVLGPVTSLHAGPPLHAVPRFQGEADAWLWATGETFSFRRRGGDAEQAEPGTHWSLGQGRLELVEVPLDAASTSETEATDGPLTLVLHYDVAHFEREGERILTLGGNRARLLAELASIGEPVSWEALAGELWGDDSDRPTLRRRFDMTLGRLRHALREARLPLDLVASDGHGLFQLRLREHDRVENRS